MVTEIVVLSKNDLQQLTDFNASITSATVEILSTFEKICRSFRGKGAKLLDHLDESAKGAVTMRFGAFGRFKICFDTLSASPWNRSLRLPLQDFGPAIFLSRTF